MTERPKDSYRNRLIEVIRSPGIVAIDEPLTLDEAIKLVNRVKKTKWFLDNAAPRWIRNGKAEIGSVYYAKSTSYFELCQYNATDATCAANRGEQTTLHILHWLAHFVADKDAPNATLHGAHFIKVYLYLVNRYLGEEQRRILKKALVEAKIKTAVVSDETRAKHRNNYKAKEFAKAKERALARFRGSE